MRAIELHVRVLLGPREISLTTSMLTRRKKERKRKLSYGLNANGTINLVYSSWASLWTTRQWHLEKKIELSRGNVFLYYIFIYYLNILAFCLHNKLIRLLPWNRSDSAYSMSFTDTFEHSHYHVYEVQATHIIYMKISRRATNFPLYTS